MSSIFGSIIGSADVEAAIFTALSERLPTYVDFVARHRGINPATTGFLIRPKSMVLDVSDDEEWPESRLPHVHIECPGENAAPVLEEIGYRTSWDAYVQVVVSARDHAATRVQRGIWGDAVRMCRAQYRSLGGFAEGLDLGPQRSDGMTTNGRTIQAVINAFSVRVAGCLDPHAGPVVFIPDAGDPPATYPDDPLVQESIVELDPQELV
jgi:hypothetical protein